MTTEKKDLKNLTDKELFDYLEDNLKKSTKKNPVKKAIKAVKKLEETH